MIQKAAKPVGENCREYESVDAIDIVDTVKNANNMADVKKRCQKRQTLDNVQKMKIAIVNVNVEEWNIWHKQNVIFYLPTVHANAELSKVYLSLWSSSLLNVENVKNVKNVRNIRVCKNIDNIHTMLPFNDKCQ